MPLIYVHAVINGRDIDAIVDRDSTHNFVSDMAMARLKLDVGKCTIHVKVFNSKSQLVARVVQDATIGLGGWEGNINLLIVFLDDFKLILRINFLTTAKADVMLHLGRMLLIEESQTL